MWSRDRDTEGNSFWHLGRIGSPECLYIFKDERGYCPCNGVHLQTLQQAKDWHKPK